MKTIAWDVDDVLNDLMRTWLESAWRPDHPGCALGYEQLSENPPHRLLGASRAEYLASLDAFRLSPSGRDLPPLDAVLAWFQRYGHEARHVAVTAVPLRAAPESAAWVMRHFGRWIRSYHVIPSARADEGLPAYDSSKGELLRSLGPVDGLVDDQPQNLESARNAGIPAVLFPRPWNDAPADVQETFDVVTQWARG